MKDGWTKVEYLSVFKHFCLNNPDRLKAHQSSCTPDSPTFVCLFPDIMTEKPKTVFNIAWEVIKEHVLWFNKFEAFIFVIA